MSELSFCSCFTLKGSANWKKSSPDDWELDVIQLTGKEKVLGHRPIDGSIFKILQTDDDKIIAVTKNN
jgi:hypothetical protein